MDKSTLNQFIIVLSQLVKLNERLSLVFQADINDVTLGFFRLNNSLQDHWRRDRLRGQTPIDQLGVQAELELSVLVAAWVGEVGRCSHGEHACNDKLSRL